MARAGRTRFRALVAGLLALLAGGVVAARAETLPADRCAGSRWVTTWATAPQDSAGRFDDQTIRSIVTTTTGGSALRITLANRFGTRSVGFDDVHVAVRSAGAAVHADTVRPVTFGGATSVRVRPGREVVSDPIGLSVAPGQDLAVSYHVGGRVPLDRHLQAVQTSYVTPAGAGRHGASVDGAAFTQPVTSWFGLVAVDVQAPASTAVVGVLGDSLTEGIGSTVDADGRWTDVLARRMGGRAAVVNAGIGGNHAARPFALPGQNGAEPVDFGPAAADRLDVDVLRRAGVTDLVVYVGINDVFTQTGGDVVADVTGAYERIAAEARAAGIRVIGATLTPFTQEGETEADRRAINRWIRSSGAFDAVVDFERAVADPADRSKLRPLFDRDRVHLTDAGYEALAEAFDHQRLLQGTGCPA